MVAFVMQEKGSGRRTNGSSDAASHRCAQSDRSGADSGAGAGVETVSAVSTTVSADAGPASRAVYVGERDQVGVYRHHPSGVLLFGLGREYPLDDLLNLLQVPQEVIASIAAQSNAANSSSG